MARLYSNENFPLPVVERLRVLACVQEVAVTPGELLADADLIHYDLGASQPARVLLTGQQSVRLAGRRGVTSRRYDNFNCPF